MKMAKASEADMNMAMDVANVLDDIERGHFPTNLQSYEDAESEQVEWIDTADRQQYERLIFRLQKLLNKGSISRVIWGMAVVCDPANECIDPDADTIEHHPKRQQLEKQVEELEKQRDRLSDLCDTWNSECDDYRADNRDLSKQLAEAIAQRDELIWALGDCVLVMEREFDGLKVIQPELNQARYAIASAKADHFLGATKNVETAVPAIIFYPAGSLGEYVDSEGGA